MKTPTEFELQRMAASFRGRDLKTSGKALAHQGTSPTQSEELQTQIQAAEQKLTKLLALIKKREAEASLAHSQAKKERSKKETATPKTVAEKANAARSNGLKPVNKPDKKLSVSELKTLATKVKGQIAVAKQKLAAL